MRIRGAVLDELRKCHWAPRSVHEAQKRITRITIQLTKELEREPTQHEIAQAMGMEEAAFAALQAETQPRQMVSLDEPADNGHGEEKLSLAERLADPLAEQPDGSMLLDESRRALVACIGQLPKSQATVIVLHYLADVPFREVARVLAVTPARVSQLHHQALARLKEAWQAANDAE
jgi:RNA polymerase sigma factor for flagellar operon FliA